MPIRLSISLAALIRLRIRLLSINCIVLEVMLMAVSHGMQQFIIRQQRSDKTTNVDRDACPKYTAFQIQDFSSLLSLSQSGVHRFSPLVSVISALPTILSHFTTFSISLGSWWYSCVLFWLLNNDRRFSGAAARDGG
jgi:hypothetical protein